MGHARSLEMAPFDRSHASFYWRSVVGVALSFIISEMKRDIGRKSRFFSVHLEFVAPVRRFPVGILPYGRCERNRMVWLPNAKKRLRIHCMFASFDTIHERTPRRTVWTDGQKLRRRPRLWNAWHRAAIMVQLRTIFNRERDEDTVKYFMRLQGIRSWYWSWIMRPF